MSATLRPALFAVACLAAAPAVAQTPELVAAAQKEGTVRWYTSAELSVVDAIGKAFEAKYPGITVKIERSGAERNFQRIAREYGSNIHAVDVVDSSDASHFLVWKQQRLLEPYVPESAAPYPPDSRDRDGMFARWRATLSVMGYNTGLVAAADAPISFAALIDPRWVGKLVKAHPGYSGTILTATYEMVGALGWPFFEKLSQEKVMQTQSANDPPRKLAAGERAVMVDGVEYTLLSETERGSKVAPIYPAEGTPFIAGSCGVMKAAPHPNAARLYDTFLLSLETQQMIVDRGALRSLHPGVKERAGLPPLKGLKLLRDDPAGTLAHADEIKRNYSLYFGI